MTTSRPKPSHHSAAYGAWFKDQLVAQAYPTRPPYPDEVVSLLVSLVAGGAVDGAAVLDLGAGTGDLARRLAPLVGRVDAVDPSEAMVEIGRALPGGNHPHIRWMLGMAEEAPLDPPYALATAGDSLHWMDWDVVLPRVARSLAPGAVLAIVSRSWDGPPALRERLVPIFERYSPVIDYRPYDMIAELTARELFDEVGRQRLGPSPWTPTVEEYVECRHSQRGFSRTHMGPEATAAFDAAVVEVLEEGIGDGTIAEREGRLQLSVTASVVWGTPRLGPASS
jgi:SAM-dependent methyltransferase